METTIWEGEEFHYDPYSTAKVKKNCFLGHSVLEIEGKLLCQGVWQVWHGLVWSGQVDFFVFN